jgi:hypothetical protein
MRAIYVPLSEGVADSLRELARRELRGTREQATWLIVDGLRRAGIEPALRTDERAALAPGDKGRGR